MFDNGPVSASLHIDTGLVVVGVAWACTTGALGAMFPALQAARMPIAMGLRQG